MLARCTAEQVLAVVEAAAVLARPSEVAKVAEMVRLPEPAAKNALVTAGALGLVSSDKEEWSAVSREAKCLPYATEQERIALLRFVLESFGPYRFFRERLAHGDGATQAAWKTKVKFSLDIQQEELRDILADLGTYCGSITPQAGGKYEVSRGSALPLTSVPDLGDLSAREQDVRNSLLKLGGEEFLEFLDANDVTTALAGAVARAADESTAQESVGYVGNAFENFLAGLAGAKSPPIDLAACQGLMSKAERLKSEGCIATKHLGYAGYLGQLRNAADHGVDPETGKQWVITRRTATEACRVLVSAMLSCFRFVSGDYRL